MRLFSRKIFYYNVGRMATKTPVNHYHNSSHPRKADLAIPVRPILSATGSAVPLIDIGANLTSKNFSRDKISEILRRASQAGVTHIILTGTSYKGSKEVLDMCALHDGTENITLRCTVGIHPHDASRTMGGPYAMSYHNDLESLIVSEIGRKYCVAVGECGLDYDRKFSTHDDQKIVFEKQLTLAKKLNKPVFLHSRDAHNDFLHILKPFLSSIKAVAHCHTDPSVDHLRELLQAGVYIGLTGMICDERPGRFNTSIIPQIPLEKLMVETDSPYLFPRNVPRPWGKWQNEPCLTSFVVEKIAEVREDCNQEEVARKTTEVALKFFGL
jgi:TatD DNase family protein